jgi:predicted enzyme related to lactoylglutathione lyase
MNHPNDFGVIDENPIKKEELMSKIVHTELITNNPKATADFVAKLFGWKVEKWNDPKMEYYMWQYPGEQIGGGGIAGISEMGSKQEPHIDIYVDVDNIASSIDKARSLGATQIIGETAIGDGEMGYFAVIQIPGGVNVGLWSKVPSKKPEQQQTMYQNK